MKRRERPKYPHWLIRPTTIVTDVGIHRLQIRVKDSFSQLFEQFCQEKGLAFEHRPELSMGEQQEYLIEYYRDDDYETLDEELTELPYFFANYLMEMYGENDPRDTGN